MHLVDFDAEAYLLRYPEVAILGMGPKEHFEKFGERMGYDSPRLIDPDLRVLFDESYYMSICPHSVMDPGGPFAHFLDHGWKTNADPHPLFSTAYYVELNPDVAASGMDPLSHYWAIGAPLGIDPHPMFNSKRVSEALGLAKGSNALMAYLLSPESAMISTHPIFDPAYYHRSYPDVANAGANPTLHFLKLGWKEKRNPSPYFDSSWYLLAHGDVAAAELNPAVHFLMAGEAEGRRAHAFFDPHWYGYGNPDLVAAGVDLYSHFIQHGDKEGRSPHALFDPQMYKNLNPELAYYPLGPFAHFMEVGGFNLCNPSAHIDLRHFLTMAGKLIPPTRHPIFDLLEAEGEESRHFHPLYDSQYQRECFGLKDMGSIDLLFRHIQIQSNIPNANRAFGTSTIPVPRRAVLPCAAESKRQTKSPASSPLISILMPCYNTDPRLLTEAVNSVRMQTYKKWELILIDDCSPDDTVLPAIMVLAKLEDQIRSIGLPENIGIARATNEGLKLAKGEYVAMLDHDDVLTPTALEAMVEALMLEGSDAAYSDQAYISEWGTFDEPFYKPQWSPTMLTGVMYVGHLLIVRTCLAREIGGFDVKYDRCQDFEFMLRVSENTSKIVHVPDILYHWRRTAGSVASDANSKGRLEPVQANAVNAHFERIGMNAIAEPIETLTHRLRIRPKQQIFRPDIAVILRADRPKDYTTRALKALHDAKLTRIYAICDTTNVSSIEGHIEAPTLALAAGKALKNSQEPYVLFFDPLVELKAADWLDSLLMYGERPDIAFTGVNLHHENGSSVAAGLVSDAKHGLLAAHNGTPSHADGYAGSLCCDREVSAVTSSLCLARREAIGLGNPFAPLFGGMYYAIGELSYRASHQGYRCITLADTHIASVDVNFHLIESDAILDAYVFIEMHRDLLKHGDPYYNQNFKPGGQYAR